LFRFVTVPENVRGGVFKATMPSRWRSVPTMSSR
jgi:hypothetical protein